MRKTRPEKTGVTASALSPQVKRIAIEEDLDRGTVRSILSQEEVTQMMAQYQSRLLVLVPKAIQACEEALDSDDLRLKVATATRVLEGLQVLHKGGMEKAIEIAGRAAPEVDGTVRKRLLLGEMTEMILEKKRRFGICGPPELEHLHAEAIAVDGKPPTIVNPADDGLDSVAEQSFR